ncbi:radical SAM protein [Patescibacteria group bacterium]|nr:radical SAM protein [Patescibacteria group bacterium]
MFRVNESESATQPEIRKLGWGFGRCNQQCKHCYNASKPQAPEFTFAELKAVADKVGPFVSDINFGTGEFVVNPNTHDLGAYLRDAYPRVNLALTTNGYSVVALRPETIKALFHDVDVIIYFFCDKRLALNFSS